jgi:translation elongation factor EF-1alpha
MTTWREREANSSNQTRKRKIETTLKELTIIDTVGSNLKTTIRSLSQSDAALLVISAEQ